MDNEKLKMDNCQLLTASSQLKKGYKQTEVGVIPSDWLLFPLEELTQKNRQYTIVDGPFGSNLKTIHYRKSGIPIITSGYVTDGKFSASEYLYVDHEKFKQEKRSAVKGGDIVMAKIGERCGASAILPKEHPEGILSGNALKISIDENRFSTELIAQILWRHHTKGDFEILRTTGAQPALSMANLKKYKIPLPPTKAEQTAIATALNDADALITQLEKLIAKKRNIKQGAMQELLRPKEGWEVKKLGEVATLKARIGWHGLTTAEYKKSGDYFLVTGTEFKNGFIDWENCFYVEEERYKQDKNIQIKEHDVLVTKDGTIGKVALIKSVPKPATLNSGVFVIRPINNEFNPEFFYYLLLSEVFLKFLSQLSAGSTINHLYQKDFVSFQFLTTKTIEEQKKIAQILSDMDAEIEVLEKKLEKYKMIKQGMMQNLLTGRVRLV